ncbi:MAG: hypothetical protein HKN68_04360 [Saprospiraceae bacterium]|nr:hypothetical protein [Saprospiraceae bacterium]
MTLLLMLLIGVEGKTQLNIKVGYSGGYMESNKIDDIIGRFNDDKPFLEQPLGNIDFLSGLELGMRYRFGISAFEVSMSDLSGDSEAFGIKDGNPFEETITTGFRSYSIGVDNFIGNFGFGASISSRRLKIDTDIMGFDRDRTVLSEKGIASRFHIFYQVKSNNVSLTLKPYIEIPWESYNISALNRDYFPDSTIPDSEFETDITIFGISLIFYNGPQK